MTESEPPSRSGNGGTTSLAALIGTLRPGIYRFFCKHLQNPEDAQDATQETLLRFLQSAPPQTVMDPAGYLIGIAKHVVFGLFKNRKRDRLYLEPSTSGDPGEDNERHDPCREAELAQLQVKMVQALTRLPTQQRQLICFRMRGMSCEEAAHGSGLSPAMAEKVRAKAYAQLAVLLQDWKIHQTDSTPAQTQAARKIVGRTGELRCGEKGVVEVPLDPPV